MEYKTISIRKVIKMINDKEMYLPEIQRGFVWKEKQVEKLFESIFVGYPIGSLLFWETDKKNIINNQLVLYNFIKDFHERDNNDNEKASEIASNYPNYYIVLDGQQRLSSLYIGLQGSLAYKLPYHWWNLDSSFPPRKLFLNLDTVESLDNEEDNKTPIFSFFETTKVPKDHMWFEASKILQFDDLSDVILYSQENELNSIQINNLTNFWRMINLEAPPIIHYLTIQNTKYDDVLNIFVRLNSSGTPLSKPDLLFSTMLLDWNGGREIIEKLIKRINNKGDKFNFSKDFIMRTCLVLSNSSVYMKVESFKKDKIAYIRDNFDQIAEAIEKATDSLVELGYSNDLIPSYNAIIPYIYYLYKGGSNKKESVDGLKVYLAISFLKNIYGIASNSALTNTRTALDNYDCRREPFNVKIFKDTHLVGDREFKVTEDDIISYMDREIGSYTLYLLTLLYPNLKLGQIRFHQDHVHPYIAFENLDPNRLSKETIERWKILRNTLPNLQLLESGDNESKNKDPLTIWIEKGNTVLYSDKDESTDLYNFENYYNKRKENIIKKLMEIFEIK